MARINFFPWLGGKHYLLSRLLALIPPHRVYVEVFGGAASLLLNKPPSEIEVYNDIDGELVNLFLAVRDHPEKFRERCETLPYSRQLYQRFLREFKEGKAPEDPVERAVRFYYLIRGSMFARFGGGWAYRRHGGSHAGTWRNSILILDRIAERLKKVYIEHSDFRRCIAAWDSSDAFFYLDPPYYATAGYRHAFAEEDHEELCDILAGVRGKWMLTYNDHPWIRRRYEGYAMIPVEAQLAAHKVDYGGRRRRLRHLVILNYWPPGKAPLKERKPLLLLI
ncbi:MAG: DNA adenine methylase [Candidatus Bathyarchaeia archaeon]